MVTGGAGFIGANLVRRLLSENESGQAAHTNRVIVFDSFARGQNSNLAEFEADPNLTIWQGDVRDLQEVDRATEGVDQIYHLSAIVGVDRYCEFPLEVIDVNVMGTRHVFECAQKKNIRVLFASTSEIFGKNPAVPWQEDADRVLGSTNVDRWTYSTSKALGEHMAFALGKSHGLRCSIVRFFNVYGPKQHPSFVVSRGIYRVLRNERPLVYDSGEQNRCFTYIDDAIDGMCLAANSDAALGEAFNIGDNTPTTIRQITDMIIEEADQKGQIEAEFVDTSKTYGDGYEDVFERVPVTDKAAHVLGWKAQVPLRTGINHFIGWARRNDWWLK